MIRARGVGRVVRDPKTNDPTDGKKKFTSVTIVSNQWAGSNPDGSPKYEPVYLDCVSFDRTAEAMAKVVKGDVLDVYGEIRINSYVKDGKTYNNLRCMVRDWDRVAAAGPPPNEAPDKSDSEPAADSDEGELFG